MGIASSEDFNPDECVVKTETAYQNLKIELDMKKAAPLMDEKTVLLTNSSMLPSSFTEYTDRPDRFYGSVLDKN